MEHRLSLGNEAAADDAALQAVRGWLAQAQRIVVLSGAGLSTDSGIPDFRGPNGVWTRNPAAEKLATLQHYLADAATRRAAWQARLSHGAWSAQPNAAHRALLPLAASGRLLAVVTQNVDELHQRAGLPPDQVIEVHGSMWRTVCWGCGERRPMHEALARVREGEADPPCVRCGGILKSDTISFGQSLEPAVIERAFEVAGQCDLLLAVGTTLRVQPVAGLVPAARAAGARVVILNDQPTAMDEQAHALVRGALGETLPALCA